MSTGAKSGQPRQTQLTYFHDGPHPVLVASNFGGSKHPQWYYNLRAHPKCRLGDESFIATEVTDPDEHARLHALAERVYTGYGDYRAKTAPVGRKIPVFGSSRDSRTAHQAKARRLAIIATSSWFILDTATMVPTRNRQGWR